MTDACVVGAGPAGLTIARELASAGRRVVLIESGGVRSSPEAQALNDGDHEGAPYRGLIATRHRAVGGTANIWDVRVEDEAGAKYLPLDPRDLAGWPIDRRELDPYYREAQRICGLGPFEYGADHWTTAERRPFDTRGSGLTSGVYQFGSAATFTRHLPEALRKFDAVTIVPSSSVVGLRLDRRARRVQGVQVASSDGGTTEWSARTVVLACGAVENARLLLLAGLGGDDRLPWLGRGFMEHARDMSMVLVPRARELLDAAAFYDLHRSRDGVLVGGRLCLTEEAMERNGLPNAAMTLVPRASRGSRLQRMLLRLGGSRAARRGPYGWSHSESPSRSHDAFSITLNLEQRSHPSNRIELGPRRDRFGNPLPRLTLRWTDREQADLEKLRGLLGAWFRASGLGTLQVTDGRPPDLSAHHHAGTTRMAAEPRDGVVDPDGCVFGFDDLFVAGASVFPTAGYANPTLTIVAMAVRLARHLHRLLG